MQPVLAAGVQGGAFTANDVQVRRFALAKTLDAIDLGVELGAEVFVMWGGREGCEVDAAMDTRAALDRYAEAVNLACEYIVEQGYRLRVRARAKPNKPRGDILLPTVGHMLAFIDELEQPDMVGVNPEFAHETMSGLSFHHAVAQALWHGKLFHIDLNAQRRQVRPGLPLRLRGHPRHVLPREAARGRRLAGMRHFDAHPYRTEDAEGVWDFARGNIRTYLILREKARRFHEDPEIQAALAAAKVEELAVPTRPEGGIAALARTGPIPSRWRNPASAWNGSTSSSTSSCSASAERTDRQLLEVRCTPTLLMPSPISRCSATTTSSKRLPACPIAPVDRGRGWVRRPSDRYVRRWQQHGLRLVPITGRLTNDAHKAARTPTAAEIH